MALHEFTFSDVYRRNAEFFPDRTAFVFEGRRITHRDYLGRIEQLAAGLGREGVRPGDRVAIHAVKDPSGAYEAHEVDWGPAPQTKK